MTIWVLDNNQETILAYKGLLHPRYAPRFFSTVPALEKALAKNQKKQPAQRPSLILSEYEIGGIKIPESLVKKKSPLLTSIPFIVVSANESGETIKKCFDLGAVDYLCKPFKPNELLVKIERFLHTDKQSKIAQKKEVTFSKESLSLQRNGEILAELTAKEFQIFCILNNANGQKVSREDIRRQVWRTVSVSPKSFDVHLFNLRKKLWALKMEIQYTPPDGYVLLTKKLKNS